MFMTPRFNSKGSNGNVQSFSIKTSVNINPGDIKFKSDFITVVYLFVIKGGSVVIDKVIFNIIEKTLEVSPTIHNEGICHACGLNPYFSSDNNVWYIILPQFSDHHLCRELRINRSGVRVIEDWKY